MDLKRNNKNKWIAAFYQNVYIPYYSIDYFNRLFRLISYFAAGTNVKTNKLLISRSINKSFKNLMDKQSMMKNTYLFRNRDATIDYKMQKCWPIKRKINAPKYEKNININ